ncbi:serine hydrolase [Pseudomonas sp. PIC25]|nr:serine hydrolase [Pseudomonas sp. PIC25]
MPRSRLPTSARFLPLPGLLLLCALATAATPQDAGLGWPERLLEELSRIDADYPGELGVFAKDLDSGLSISFRGEETWYLASGIKVPVAIAVLRGVERGEFALDDRLLLEVSDYVDGAGETNRHPPGTRLSVRFLLEQMVIHSDNSASDRLIRLVGIEAVNRVVEELVPGGFQPITSLADVRRHAYSQLHPAAFCLSGRDFLQLKQQRSDTARRATLARQLGVAPTQLRPLSLGEAFEAYYATRLNSARLSAYGELLEALVNGKALGAEGSAHLLGLMERVATGRKRIKAGLPTVAAFLHKTGTQRSRFCDLGIVRTAGTGGDKRLIVAACTRGDSSLARSETALRLVGQAVWQSGALLPAPEELEAQR